MFLVEKWKWLAKEQKSRTNQNYANITAIWFGWLVIPVVVNRYVLARSRIVIYFVLTSLMRNGINKL
jgi:hypothetical protein